MLCQRLSTITFGPIVARWLTSTRTPGSRNRPNAPSRTSRASSRPCQVGLCAHHRWPRLTPRHSKSWSSKATVGSTSPRFNASSASCSSAGNAAMTGILASRSRRRNRANRRRSVAVCRRPCSARTRHPQTSSAAHAALSQHTSHTFSPLFGYPRTPPRRQATPAGKTTTVRERERTARRQRSKRAVGPAPRDRSVSLHKRMFKPTYYSDLGILTGLLGASAHAAHLGASATAKSAVGWRVPRRVKQSAARKSCSRRWLMEPVHANPSARHTQLGLAGTAGVFRPPPRDLAVPDAD